jgi:hypothetical protein
MNENRSLLFHGLGLTLRRLPALLWAFAFNFIYSAMTTAHIASAIGTVTDTSLAAQPLKHGFDLGSLAALNLRLAEGPGVSPLTGVSILLYLTTYFLLVPGTLLCYQTGVPARLSTLLQAGLMHFWRFVRITILTGIVMALILGPLAVLYTKLSSYIDEKIVGRPGLLYELAAMIVIALIAASLRHYFDLVEVYTVQLGLQLRSNGKPDRRVRKTLGPAFRALRHNFGRAYLSFVLLSASGLLAVFVTARISLHSLAQARVWPMFLLAQSGLFMMLLTRFWQRGAETTLSLDFPIFEAPIVRTTFAPREPSRASFIAPAPITPVNVPTHEHEPAQISDPDPITPSLSEPDPGIYHPQAVTPEAYPTKRDPDLIDL